MKNVMIIVNYNDFDTTKRLLDNVKDYKCLDKIIVVDNHSSDKSLSKLFGIGFITNYATDIVSTKLIEMDLFDIFYRVGVVGFILFIIPIIKGVKNVFENKNVLVIFSVILALIISILVGHTLTAPSVSILLLYVLKYKKR